MKPLFWFVENPETGARLCKDMMWRFHVPPQGTERHSLKTYKTKGWAERVAWKYRVDNRTLIRAMYPDEELNAAGRITKRSAT